MLVQYSSSRTIEKSYTISNYTVYVQSSASSHIEAETRWLSNHDGNKSLTKPMLTYHHEGEWHYSEGNFIEDTSAINH